MNNERRNMLFPRIYAAQNPAQAAVVISFLKTQGFHPLDLQMSPSVCLAGADQFCHVQVLSEEAQAAMAVLKGNGYSDGIAYQTDDPNAG
jgi:hypothetical protein